MARARGRAPRRDRAARPAAAAPAGPCQGARTPFPENGLRPARQPPRRPSGQAPASGAPAHPPLTWSCQRLSHGGSPARPGPSPARSHRRFPPAPTATRTRNRFRWRRFRFLVTRAGSGRGRSPRSGQEPAPRRRAAREPRGPCGAEPTGPDALPAAAEPGARIAAGEGRRLPCSTKTDGSLRLCCGRCGGGQIRPSGSHGAWLPNVTRLQKGTGSGGFKTNENKGVGDHCEQLSTTSEAFLSGGARSPACGDTGRFCPAASGTPQTADPSGRTETQRGTPRL